jgi:hypothetical protein
MWFKFLYVLFIIHIIRLFYKGHLTLNNGWNAEFRVKHGSRIVGLKDLDKISLTDVYERLVLHVFQ